MFQLPAYSDLFLPNDGSDLSIYVNSGLSDLCLAATGAGLGGIMAQSRLKKLKQLTADERLNLYQQFFAAQ